MTLTVLAAWGAGCSGNSSVERSLDRPHSSISASLDGAVTEEGNYVLPVDGIVDLDLQTFGGDVVIRSGQDTKGEARMMVTVAARHGSDRKEEATASLKDISVKAEIRRGGDVPTLVMRCETSHDEAWLHRTNIDIEVSQRMTSVGTSPPRRISALTEMSLRDAVASSLRSLPWLAATVTIMRASPLVSWPERITTSPPKVCRSMSTMPSTGRT
jgi:hypothetical protein